MSKLDEAFTRGLVNAITRNGTRNICSCGFAMPKYPGRYPSACPVCSTSVAMPAAPTDSIPANPGETQGESMPRNAYEDEEFDDDDLIDEDDDEDEEDYEDEEEEEEDYEDEDEEEEEEEDYEDEDEDEDEDE